MEYSVSGCARTQVANPPSTLRSRKYRENTGSTLGVRSVPIRDDNHPRLHESRKTNAAKKPGTVSRPGAVPQFLFPNYTEPGRVSTTFFRRSTYPDHKPREKYFGPPASLGSINERKSSA